MTIEHRPGSQHRNADGLSRRHCSKNKDDFCCKESDQVIVTEDQKGKNRVQTIFVEGNANTYSAGSAGDDEEEMSLT